ncbi:FecR family protein [Zhouia sp. PK063]|uniref:FecR family protein n=1 Tax=Zhouia sp. PK063 TaxID=3373602 RepID=UPI0037BA7EA7
MESLLHKFLKGTLSEVEWDEFLSWLEVPENRKQLKQHLKTEYLINRLHDANDLEKRFENLNIQSHKEVKVRKLFSPLKVAAAIFAIVFLTGLGWLFLKNKPVQTSIEPLQIVQGTDRALLTLDNGSEITLNKGKTYKNTYVSSNGQKVVYQKNSDTRKVVYNYLTVPLGGQFSITLADGTKVWLNSGSKIKYPVTFNGNGAREVELMYGEAYFEVTPATENDGKAFQILHNQQKVTVIGTQFNIKAYPEESHIYTTVTKGKVAVDFKGNQVFLLPNKQADVNLNTDKVDVKTVDADAESAWRNGLFVFQSKSLQEITTVLSRWYNVNITINNTHLDTINFKGTLNKNIPLDEVLDLIKSTHFINEYTIDNDGVTIQ